MTVKTKQRVSAQKALEAAQKEYDRLKDKGEVRPNFQAERGEVSAKYAQKIRDLISNKKENTDKHNEAINKLKTAYAKKRETAMDDAIDGKINRSSIIDRQLGELNQEEKAETTRQKKKLMQDLDKISIQISDLEKQKTTELNKITEKEKRWDENEAHQTQLKQAKKDLDKRKQDYNQAVKDEKAEKAKQEKAQDAIQKRPSGISDKQWNNVQRFYADMKGKTKAEVEKYINENAEHLRLMIGDLGMQWLERQFGFYSSAIGGASDG